MYYVLDENNNRQEAYSKEEILSVLAQAIADGSLSGITADAGFISKLKCCVSGQTIKIAFVTQAKYNELEASGQREDGVYYYIIDDTTCEDIDETLKTLTENVNNLLREVSDLKTDVNVIDSRLNDLSLVLPRNQLNYGGSDKVIYASGNSYPMTISQGAEDLRAISGTLKITASGLPYDGTALVAHFSTNFVKGEWNEEGLKYKNATFYVNTNIVVDLQDNSQIYVYNLNIIFKMSSGKFEIEKSSLGIPFVSLVCLNDNSRVNIDTITLEKLNLFYN